MLLYFLLAILMKEKGIGMLYIFHYHYHNYYSIAGIIILISIHIFFSKVHHQLLNWKDFFSNISYYQ